MWLSFLIIAGLAAMSLSAMSWTRLSTMLGIILGLGFAALCGVSLWFFREPVFLREADEWWKASPWREIVLFGSMIAGMTARYLTVLIEARRRRMAKVGFAKRGRIGIRFDGWEFAYPLLISVVTFSTVVAQTGAEDLSLANVLLSFQTGFFWETVLARSEALIRDGEPST